MSNKDIQKSRKERHQRPSFIYEFLGLSVGLGLVWGMIVSVGGANGHKAAQEGQVVASTVQAGDKQKEKQANSGLAMVIGAPSGRETSNLPDTKAVTKPHPAPSLAAYAKGQMRAFVAHKSPRLIPNISFVDGAGGKHSLKDMRGKLVLLNLWATWCGPCRHEMPTLDALQKRFEGRSFEVLALNIDRRGLKKAHRFFKQIGVKYLTLYGDNGSRAGPRLRAFAMPTTLLINRRGMEIGRLMGGADWSSKDALALIEAALQAKI